MTQHQWSAVDGYFDTVLGDEDPALAAAAQAHIGFDLPDIGVSRSQESCCTCWPSSSAPSAFWR